MNDKGMTLVEIVVTTTLVLILGSVFFNLIISNFNLVQLNILDNKHYRDDVGEIFQNYNNTSQGTSEKILFFGKEVTLRKLEGTKTHVQITISDSHKQEKPFLDKNNNLIYDAAIETELDATDLLNINYTDTSGAILVVPSNLIFEGISIQKINWNIKGGIYIQTTLDLDVSESIRLHTNEKLSLKSSILNPISLKANDNIILEGLDEVTASQTYIESKKAIIIQGTNIYLSGTDRFLTTLNYDDYLELNGIKAKDVSDIGDITGVWSNSMTLLGGLH